MQYCIEASKEAGPQPCVLYLRCLAVSPSPSLSLLAFDLLLLGCDNLNLRLAELILHFKRRSRYDVGY